MKKASSIVMVVVAGALLASPGLADGRSSGLAGEASTRQSKPAPKSPVLAQEEGRRNDPRLVGTSGAAARSPVLAQEEGRRNDPRLGTSGSTPVLVVGPSDGFHFVDAAIGAALGLSFALLAMAAISTRQRIRRRAGAVGA